MKSLGIVRKVDELGRIVLPIELRRTLNIGIEDPVAIFVDGNTIILRKHETSCIFCGGTQDLTVYMNKNVCESCIKELK